mmetsp:Transcript_6553/g.15067  ORF Transcript_6553/g.15067 Transcript_6553/m.15067 type:complete len:87 (+) Transcript_6553:85-345(+)
MLMSGMLVCLEASVYFPMCLAFLFPSARLLFCHFQSHAIISSMASRLAQLGYPSCTSLQRKVLIFCSFLFSAMHGPLQRFAFVDFC